MKKFLKEYSTVPNEFIDDFFDIVDEKYIDVDITINFDKVIKWLNIRKDNLKRTLVKYFSENIDYSIKKNKIYNSDNHGANYVEEIMITPDCFKNLCMISLTAKAKEVRMYYLSLEKLVKKYHEYIEEKLRNKINLLETNQKPKIDRKKGIIYFFKALNNIKIEDIEEDLHKIGKTDNKSNRFGQYNSGNANDIEPLFILEVDDLEKVEKCIKNLLEEYQYRKKKEIYQINVDALKTVFVKCESLVKGFKDYMKKTPVNTANKNFRNMRHSHNGLVMYFKK